MEKIDLGTSVRGATVAAASLAVESRATADEHRPTPTGPVFTQGGRTLVAIQVDSTAAAADGIENVLDAVQQRAAVNTLLIDSFWFGADVSRAKLAELSRKRPLQAPDSTLVGGRVGFVNSKYYSDARLDLSALGSTPGVPDILAAYTSAARRRGIRVFALVKDELPEMAGGYEKLREQDFNGQAAETSCKANPYYRALATGAAEDLIRSYDVDGIMYMVERQGAFTDTLGLRFRGLRRGLPGSRTCFCSYCRETGKKAGINVDRAIKGFGELEKFTAAGRARRRPVDGYYVSLWRLILRFPELLAWEHFWHENTRQLYRMMYDKVKSVRSNVLYGMHVWPNISMNPLLSAETDFAELGQYNDFIKMALYRNAGGPRMASYVESAGQTMFGDLPPEEVLEFHYRVLNYKEAPLSQVRQTGLKGDFVYRQTKRAVDGAKGTNAMILAGLDVDIPVTQLDMGAADLRTAARNSRADVKDAVTQAFKAGVPGIVISRDYAEMDLENLSGVGDAIRELKLTT